MRCIALFFALFVLSTPSLASETEFIYRYNFGDTGAHVPHTIDNDAGVFELVEFKYDLSSETLSTEIRLSIPSSPERLANSFVLILSEQRYPDIEGSEYAALYFDATGSAPILSAYTYEPKPEMLGWDSLSFLHGEAICTSANSSSCSGWIQKLQVVNNSDGSRTFKFSIDASHLNDFTPVHPNENGKSWVGAQFADKIGFWLIPYGYPEMSYQYDSEGYIHSISLDSTISNEDRKGNQYHGFFDGDDEDTFRAPFCEPAAGASLNASVGVESTLDFGCVSPEGSNFLVNYQGVPTNASVTPEEGATVGPLVMGELKITPSLEQGESSYQVEVLCTELNSDTQISCPFTVEVPPADLQCEGVDITSSQFELDSTAFSQFQLVKQLTKRYLQIARGTSNQTRAKRFRKRANKQARTLYLESWGLTYSLDSLQQQCSSSLCVSKSNVEVITTYVGNSDELLTLAKKTNRQIQRRHNENARRLVRRSRQLSEVATDVAAGLPTETSECSDAL